MRKHVDKKNLECDLRDDELLKYSQEMAEYLSKKSGAEAQKKSFNAQIGSVIAECEEHLNLLGNKIRSKKEYRDVECRIEYDWDRKIKTWYRNDTNAFVYEDVITIDDLQEELVFVNKELAAIPKKKSPPDDLVKKRDVLENMLGIKHETEEG